MPLHLWIFKPKINANKAKAAVILRQKNGIHPPTRQGDALHWLALLTPWNSKT